LMLVSVVSPTNCIASPLDVDLVQSESTILENGCWRPDLK
jgi:hypothetical protein